MLSNPKDAVEPTKQELFNQHFKDEVSYRYADQDETKIPSWFAEYFIDFQKSPKDAAYTLEEFSGRFKHTTTDALYEIRRHKLFGCGEYHSTGKTYWIPIPEVDRYAAILEAEKLATSPPVKHPCLNSGLEFHSKRLALALEAWEYAISQKSIKKNFMQRIEAFLKKHNVSDSDTARIKEICNPWPRGPKSSNKI